VRPKGLEIEIKSKWDDFFKKDLKMVKNKTLARVETFPVSSEHVEWVSDNWLNRRSFCELNVNDMESKD
jgi:hypothetical protein